MCNTNDIGIRICVITTNVMNQISVAQYPLILTSKLDIKTPSARSPINWTVTNKT